MPQPALSEPVRFGEAADRLRRRAASIADTLRGRHDGAARIEHLDWTLWELAAHLVSVPRIYRRVVARPDSFEVPEHMGEFGQRELEAVGVTELRRLADLLVEAVDELVAELTPLAGTQVGFYTTVLAASGVLGVALNELSMHHRDMTAVTGETFEMSDRDVVITLHGMMPASEIFCDAAVARRIPGVYHLGLRDGPDWTISVASGLVTVSEGRPVRADVRIVGRPLPMVLMSFGRTNPIGSVLRGEVLAWGRRPWKLWWLRSLFVEEISRNGRGAPVRR